VTAHPSPEAGLPGTATPAQRSGPIRAIAWMLLASALFSLMALFSRKAAEHAVWTEVAFARAFFGLLVAFSVARYRGMPLKVQDQRLGWGRSLCGTISMLCTFYVYASPGIALGDAAALLATSPVFIAILAPFVLGERSGRAALLATPIAFMGVLVLVRPQLQIAGPLAALATFGAFVSAAAMMFLRRLGPTESPEAVATQFSAIATVITLIIALPTLVRPDLGSLFWLSATGVSAGIGQLAMTRAYALDHAARVGTVGYAGVVMTQVLAILFLGETATWSQLVGTTLVIGAGLLLAIGALRRL
jgi:drug/metabolite transporter (DMT)-like permease